MESFWPNEMRTTSVECGGEACGGGNWCLGTGWGLGNGYDNFYDSRLIEMRMYWQKTKTVKSGKAKQKEKKPPGGMIRW